MKNTELNPKKNYSKAGRASAKKYSYILNRNDKINEILKDKQYKRYLDEDYFEKKDKDISEDSKDLNYEDIFDNNYKDRYSIYLSQQKSKYFKCIKSCAFNKKFISEDNKDYNPNKFSKPANLRKNTDNKQIYLDNNPDKSYLYKKISYSQSFDKMIGRYDRLNTRKKIEEKLDSLKNNDNTTKKKKKNKKTETKKPDENPETKKTDEKTPLTDSKPSPDKGKLLEKGFFEKNHNIRTRTTKRNNTKKEKSMLFSKINPFSPKFDKKKFTFRRNNRLFSLDINRKDNLLINNNKNMFDNKSNPNTKRIFSGFNSNKDINKIKENSSSRIKFSSKKDLTLTPDFGNRKKTISSNDFNYLKRNMLNKHNISYTFKSMSKTNLNFKEKKSRNKLMKLNSAKSNEQHNNAISFKKMLSREYVNRKHKDDKIGAGMPLTPNYDSIYPKILNSVKYTTKFSLSKKTKLREMYGINISEKKNEDISNNIYFSKMVGRGDMNSEYPIFMNSIYSRNAFDFVTAKSLKMNNDSKRNLNNPISSFINKKSFNSNLENTNYNIKHDSIKNIKTKKEREDRIKNYNNNMSNIFKKVIYDNLIDKNDIMEDEFYFENNPKLIKKINSSYKNIMSDYYKLNLDYLDKNLYKKKIDGITFQEIKNKNKIDFNTVYNNPLKIKESEIEK